MTEQFDIQSVPTEILQQILRHLSALEDVYQCVYVCKRWSFISLEILWYKPDLTSHYCQQTKSSFFQIIQTGHRTMFPYASFIRRINLSPLSISLNDAQLLSLRCCRRLERLTLAGCSRITNTGLFGVIFAIGSSLISIDLSDVCEITDMTVLKIAEYCHNLQGFNLSMSIPHLDITDKSIISLSRQCRSLKRIKLNNCINITERAIIELTTNCPRLLEIDITNCHVDNIALQFIFFNCKELRELRVNQMENTSRLRITDKAFSLLETNYEQLRLVDFTGIYTLTDANIHVLVEASPRIRSLVLNKCNRITDEGVLSICKLGKYLHFLHLGHCTLISDKAVTQLVASCNRIRYLDMACCLNISDRSIVEIAKNLTKLKRIGLVKCVYITDFAITALACFANSLERVHLSYCTRLSVKAISRLLNVCHLLNHLSLTNVPSFQRRDLQEFRRTPPKGLTDMQRNAFCVYSGKGVEDLKNYLNIIYPTPESTELFGTFD